MTFSENRIQKKIICLNIDLISYKEALGKITSMGKSKTPSYVCFANVHMIIEAYKNSEFSEQVNNATLVLSDGMPVVKTLKLFHSRIQDRIAGMDIFPDLIKSAESNNLKVFFFGTSPELLEKIKIKTEKEFPNVNVVGLLSPPFNKSLDDQSYIDIIKSSRANLVFVALGCPKQEKWMANNSHKINATLLGVGGAFSIYAGTAKRAPLFMRNIGMEWLYRLFREPKRLFGRYFITNSIFLFLLSKELLNKLIRTKIS